MRLSFCKAVLRSGFVKIVSGVAVLGDEGIAFGGLQVFGGHFFDQGAEVCPGRPAEFYASLGGVAQQGFHLSRAEVTGVDGYDRFSMLIVGLFAFPGLHVTAIGWLTLIWVAALGLLATIPLGILLGSLIADPRFVGAIVLPFAGLAAISGIFYPITHLPGWLQSIGQVFPMYWLGLGMRAALLPSALQSVELDGSWRLGYVLLALCGWAALGLLAAPPVLRRMAQRESGSKVMARRERAMLRRT